MSTSCWFRPASTLLRPWSSFTRRRPSKLANLWEDQLIITHTGRNGSTDERPGALSDLLVIDLTRVLAGPMCTMLLGDLGAQVIKVEHPERGDDSRHWGPPFTEAGMSAYYLSANRNKRSMTLNIKHPRGQDVLRELVGRADILVENFKVGAMAGMGLDYPALSALNPGLIYCAITGYGQTGPHRDRPGYDAVIEAQGGLMSITGPAEGEPYKVGVAVADVTSGLFAWGSILAALHHRERTGEGQFVDIALFDTQIGWLANVASSYLVSGEAPARYGNAHPTVVPYQTLPTADGWIVLAVGNDSQFRRLCEVLDRSGWSVDERFATNPARVRNRVVLLPMLEALFKLQPTSVWADLLCGAGVPCGPVNDVPAALAEPQVAAREMVQSIEHPVNGRIPQIGPVPKLSRTPARITSAPPLLGEHTEEVLHNLLGYGPREIAALRAADVI